MMIDEIDKEIRPSTYFIYLLQLFYYPRRYLLQSYYEGIILTYLLPSYSGFQAAVDTPEIIIIIILQRPNRSSVRVMVWV